MDDLLELSGDAMHYVVIHESLVESLRMKLEDDKRTKLEYYIADVNPECCYQYKAIMSIDSIQPNLITNMYHRMVKSNFGFGQVEIQRVDSSNDQIFVA